jgi:hypothetical protein
MGIAAVERMERYIKDRSNMKNIQTFGSKT